MPRREYGQDCSLACALDSVGERWSLLIVRELLLGPLRFSDLARAVGGAPTDVLTKRLRDLEADGVVARRELAAPVGATVYELTELGRGLERPMIELARWGMELQKAEDVVGLAPSSLPNALRTCLRPPAAASFDLGLRSGGQSFALRARDGWIVGSRGTVGEPDLTLSGSPIEVLAAVVIGPAGVPGVEIEGDAALLDDLHEMVVVPDRLRDEAQMLVESGALLIAAAEAAPPSAEGPPRRDARRKAPASRSSPGPDPREGARAPYLHLQPAETVRLEHLGGVERRRVAADGLGVAAIAPGRVAAGRRGVAAVGGGATRLTLRTLATAGLAFAERHRRSAPARKWGQGDGNAVAVPDLRVAGVGVAAVPARRAGLAAGRFG